MPVGYVLKVHKNLGDDIKALGIRIHNFNSISLFFSIGLPTLKNVCRRTLLSVIHI